MSKNVFNTQASTQTIIGGTITSGVTPRLAYYTGTNEIDDTDIDYTANEGLTRVDGLKYVRQRGTSTHIGTFYNGPSGGRAIVIGERALDTYTAVCDESIAIGPQAGTNLNTLYHSILLGTNAGLGLGTVTTRVINDSVAIGWRTLVSAQSIINSITIGHNVYESLTNGISNINIGNPGTGITTENNTTRIGSSQNRCFIAGIRGASPDIANGLPVVCSSTGQLTTQPYPESPISPGTTGRMAFYNSSSTIANTDIDYIEAQGLVRSDNLAYVYNNSSNTSLQVGNTLNPAASHTNSIIVGKNAMTLAPTPTSNNSVIIGENACSNSAVVAGTVAIGHRINGTEEGILSNNVLIGDLCCNVATDVNNTICIGKSTYFDLITGNNNINIGDGASSIAAESNVIRIGNSGFSQTKCFIQGIRGITPELSDGLPVVISSTGQLSSASSAPVNTGTVGRLAFYDSVNSVDDTDIAYTASRGLVRSSDNLAYIYNNATNTSLQVWNTLNPAATYFDSITMGKNILALATSPICNTSVLIGGNVCQNVLSSSGNVAIGHRVVDTGAATTLSNNVLIGNLCCNNVTNLTLTTCIGRNTYSNLLTGSNNVNIGDGATGVTAESDTIRIGNTLLPQTRCFIGGIRGITPALTDGQVVEITSDRQLTSSSSYVKGPINSIDNRIATYSGVTGKLLSNLSAITADGAANMSGVNVLTAKVLDMVGGGAIYLANTVSSIVGTIRNQSGWLFHTGITGFDTYLGYNSGNFTGTGLNNTVVGATSLQNFTSGANNIVVGTSSGGGLTTHTDNIIIGNNVTGLVGSNNISIGNITGVAEINTLRIGNTQTRCIIPPINIASPTGDTRLVYIDSVTGQLTAKTGLYKPMAEVFYGDGGVTTASFTMVVQNQWYGIDSSNFTTGAWTLETNNAKFLAAKWDNNGVPGQVRYISSTMDMSHTALSVCMSAANAGHTIQMCILKDNVPIPSTIVFYDFVNNNVFASMAYHKILTMTLNKVYKLGIRCVSNNNSAVTLYNLNFVLLNMETLI